MACPMSRGKLVARLHLEPRSLVPEPDFLLCAPQSISRGVDTSTCGQGVPGVQNSGLTFGWVKGTENISQPLY